MTPNITDWSDSNLTLAIAKFVYPDAKVERVDTGSIYEIFAHIPNHDVDEYTKKLNYCNNWNDLMPLAVQYFFNHPEWLYKSFESDNTQRVLAEYLYLVLLAKQEQDSE